MSYMPTERGAAFGWVVRNLYGQEAVEGKDSPFLTKDGKVAIFPDFESIPMKWREHAEKATKEQAMEGELFPQIRQVQQETSL